ncbi:MAG: MFS transporter [Caldilineaceae bacterium]
MANISLARQSDANLRWNFTVNVLDIMFITLGFSMISRDTVIPVLMSTLTDSKIAIGLIPALWAMGYYLPQLLMANFTEGLRYKKPFVVLVSGIGERLPYLAMALAVWLWAADRPTWAVVVILGGLLTASAAAGIATPAWYDMIAKVIPVHRRGIWSGTGRSLGAGLGIIGAYFVGRILVAFPYPNNYAILFLIASFWIILSWVALTLNREPPSEHVKPKMTTRQYLRKLPSVLRRNPNYSRYLISRSTIQLGAMAAGFYMVYGVERFAIDGATIGALTSVIIGTQAVMNLVWGSLGDRLGHKTVLMTGAFVLATASLLAWQAQSVLWIGVVLFLLGSFLAADAVSALNIILEFCAPEDRPTYIGLTNTLLAPVVTVAPILGGWLAEVSGYPVLFGVAIAASALGGLLMMFWVKEPRMGQMTG